MFFFFFGLAIPGCASCAFSGNVGKICTRLKMVMHHGKEKSRSLAFEYSNVDIIGNMDRGNLIKLLLRSQIL